METMKLVIIVCPPPLSDTPGYQPRCVFMITHVSGLSCSHTVHRIGYTFSSARVIKSYELMRGGGIAWGTVQPPCPIRLLLFFQRSLGEHANEGGGRRVSF